MNNIAIGYLRAFVTVLVLAFHSSLAYATFAPSAIKAFTSEPYMWVPYPVVDSQRWPGFDLIVVFNDTFFMSLMFFLAGLFVWPSISRKGYKDYLQNRIVRLGVPFVGAAVLLSPLAYYPAYVISGADPGAANYFQQFLSLDYWSPGAAWFIAVLLGFDFLAALLYRFAPGLIETVGKLCSGADRRPARFFLGLLGISFIAYSTMCFLFDPLRWFTFGPFMIQAGRVFLYLTYFFAGVVIGIRGIERGLLAKDGYLARRWPLWLGLTFFAFALFVFFNLKALALGAAAPLALLTVVNAAFVFTCGATSFFLLAVFVRFFSRRIAILDSLVANAYGIYLVHYAIVSWLQYALLNAQLSAIQKGATVFFATLLLSWGAAAAIRSIPFVGHTISGGVRPVRN